MRLGGIVVILWLVIGLAASAQRGYLAGDNSSCAKAGTIAVTVLAGPLNYLGVNPKIKDCNVPVPQPSK